MSGEAAPCFLCGRPLGERVEWHHSVPANPQMARFIAWVSDKAPDLHAPTWRAKR